MTPDKIPALAPDADTAMAMLRMLIRIRRFEERIIKIYPTDVMVTPVHLQIGQEAVPVGVCAHLRDRDTIFFGHRTHGPALAKGLPMEKFMAELYGRKTGCARGFGGSMHVVDPEHGVLGSSAIVGGAIALGVGSALAAKLSGEDRIAVSYFGDAATNSGVFWESMNFAALKEVPVLMVCENNGLSILMPQSEHMFADITDAAGRFMPVERVDGTDPAAVYDAAGRAIRYIRTEGKPAFIECKTKRWMQHQGVEMDDIPTNVVDRERDDPILKFKAWMIRHNLPIEGGVEGLVAHADAEVEAAVQFAIASEFSDEAELLQEV